MATPDNRFVLVGVPSTSSFCVFSYDKGNLMLTMQKRICVDGFRTFEMDRYATQVVFLNQKCRALDLYSLKWRFETKNATETKEFEKLDEAQIEEAIKGSLPGERKKEDPLASQVG